MNKVKRPYGFKTFTETTATDLKERFFTKLNKLYDFNQIVIDQSSKKALRIRRKLTKELFQKRCILLLPVVAIAAQVSFNRQMEQIYGKIYQKTRLKMQFNFIQNRGYSPVM